MGIQNMFMLEGCENSFKIQIQASCAALGNLIARNRASENDSREHTTAWNKNSFRPPSLSRSSGDLSRCARQLKRNTYFQRKPSFGGVGGAIEGDMPLNQESSIEMDLSFELDAIFSHRTPKTPYYFPKVPLFTERQPLNDFNITECLAHISDHRRK